MLHLVLAASRNALARHPKFAIDSALGKVSGGDSMLDLASLPQKALNRMGLDWRLGAINPTVELYFSGPLADLIAVGLGPRSGRPIRQVGPHVFTCGSVAIIVRYAQPSELNFLRQRSFSHVYYVMDDLFSGLETDSSLPEGYRRRLMAFAGNRLPKILELATVLIVPNTVVATGLENFPIEILQPSAVKVCSDFSHFDHGADGPIDLLLSGSRSHAADIEMIAPGILRALRRNHRLRVTSFLGEMAPRSLRNHSAVRNHPQLPWSKFRQVLQRRRFHAAAAPYRDTPFNGARSINKILDHGAVGAVGLYSNRAPHSRYVSHMETGVLMADDHYDWSEAILEVAGRPRQARRLAARGAALANELGDRRRVRQFWLERLALN